MDKLMEDVERTKLTKKLARRIGPGEASEMIADLESESQEELEQRLLDLAKTQQGIVNTRNADQELSKLAEEVSYRRREYTTQLSANKDLQRLVSLVISERFGDALMDLKTVSTSEDEQ